MKKQPCSSFRSHSTLSRLTLTPGAASDQPAPPLLCYPKVDAQQSFRLVFPKKVTMYEFFALSDGKSKIFTNEDQLPEYRGPGILDPATVSCCNLFINGVLQPKENYEVTKGKLILKTADAPIKNAVIALQMIKII